ncbi:MAG TPA: ABC transporter substrate-binding protein [Sphingomicrobium sp.]|nr:ABC transporter substrate-binding protein [Sphingomicrobium sp.]
MRRREVIAGLGAALATPLAGQAQPPSPRRRVGFLHPGRSQVASMRAASFGHGLLAGVGAREGLEVVSRIAEEENDRLPGMAAELVGLGVEAIAAVSPSAVHAAYKATRNIPIVAVDLESDPVANGWAASLGRPGGNVTGVFLDLPELSAKCLQLLRETVPELTKLGVLWDPATGSVPLQALERVTGSLNLAMGVQEVRRAGDFEGAFRAIGPAEGTGVLMLPSPLFSSNLQLLADLSLAHRFPAITLFPEFARTGGLLAYGPDLPRLFRQAGALTRKILEGANPAEQPIERPARFQLVVNLKTAEALGVTVATSVLLLADEVIE